MRLKEEGNGSGKEEGRVIAAKEENREKQSTNLSTISGPAVS